MAVGRQPVRWLPRPRLERRLDLALTRRLTTLTAASGYGKSALLQRWGTETGAVTHRITPRDRDLGRLAGKVAAALRLRAPGLSTEVTDALTAPLGPAAGTPSDRRAAALGGWLGEALQTALHRDLVLILDDVDVLGPKDGAARFLDALLRSAPHRLHVVTASQHAPPFAVARLRADEQVLELTAADLALDLDDAAVWLETIVRADAGPLAADLLALTGGWPIAVLHTLGQLRQVPATDQAAWLAEAEPPAAVDDLVLAAFEAQPQPARDLLHAATLVPSIDAALATELGLDPALLAQLRASGTFLYADESVPGRYRLTPTALAALRRDGTLDRQARQDLARRASAACVAQGRVDHALRTLLDTDLTEELEALLRDHLARLEDPAVADDVLAALEQLPAERRHDPVLARLAGVANQLRGRWDLARPILERVAETDAFDATVAWRLGLILHLQGELEAALATYLRGAALDPPADGAICAAWAASVYWLRGDREACAQHADDALARASRLDDDRARAAAHMVLAMLAALDGDRRANDAHYLRAIEHAERAADILQLIRIRSNRASHHLEEGAYTDALEELAIARRLSDLTGFTPFGAMTLSNRAEVMQRLGRLEEAAADAADAVAAWRTLGSKLVVYGLEQQAAVLALRGDTRGAEETYREAIAIAEAAGDVQGLVPGLAGLAELLLDDDLEQAETLTDRALGLGEGIGYVAACLAATRVALAQGDRLRAHELLARAEELAAARRDQPALATAAELSAELLGDVTTAEQAVERWQQIGDLLGLGRAELLRARLTGDATVAHRTAVEVRDRLHAIGCHRLDQTITTMLGTAEAAASGAVTIETLGTFRVLIDGLPIQRSAWQSRRARELIKLLAARRGRPVARDWLAERLWDDTDPQTAGKRLNVMVSTARGVLDPERSRPSDHVIAGDRETLRLDLRHVHLDVDHLLGLVEEAARLERRGRTADALERWRAAEAAYSGDFCEDEPYAEWAVGMREEARAGYAEAVVRVASAESALGNHDSAIRLWLRLLERDPYDERAHLALVRSLGAAGRHGDARRRYLTYVERVRELGVEPAPFPVGGDA